MAISSITLGFAGPRISREVSFSDNGDGTVKKTTNVILPNGREISRERVRDGQISPSLLSGNINGLRGIRTYVPEAGNTDESAKYTSERGKIVRTILIERPVAEPQPVENPPTASPEEPLLADGDAELASIKALVTEAQIAPSQVPVPPSLFVNVLESKGKSSESLQRVYEKLSERFDSASRAYQAAVVPKLQEPVSLPPVQEIA